MLEETIITILKWCATAFIIVLIVSPTYFFALVERYLFDSKEADADYIQTYKPELKMPIIHSDEYLDNELRKLESYNKICNSNLNKEARRIWENKRNEYIRYLNWNKLKETASATEKAPR